MENCCLVVEINPNMLDPVRFEIAKRTACRFIVCFLLLPQATGSRSETGYDAWLRYQSLQEQARLAYASLPKRLVLVGDSQVLNSARDELSSGLLGMLSSRVSLRETISSEPSIILGNWRALAALFPQLKGA